MLTGALLAVAAGAAVVAYLRWAGSRMRAEAGVQRVRVADLFGWLGCRVQFRHPTRRREYVRGRLVAARESALCLAWNRLTIEAADGSRTDYEVAGRDWAEVAQ